MLIIIFLLGSYFYLFTCYRLINEEPNLVNICAIASRAKVLAEFVARQMSGPDPTSTCVDHQLEVHLREIKEFIGTSVIPLGQLRVGSYLERAILFKVLADRICLPTALVRGEYGTAWVEIAIPQVYSYIFIDFILFYYYFYFYSFL